MPTGYTAKVEDGTVTELRDYMLICARAFGALVTMRDDPMDAPIPEKLQPSTSYYDIRIPALTSEIRSLTAMTADEVMTHSLAANDEARRRHRESEAADQLRLERHLAMAEKVKAWEPPTPDHAEYKAFMLDQLDISSKWLGTKRELPEMPVGEEWRRRRLASLSDELARAKQSRAEEIERTNQRQRWLDDLRASLPPASSEVAA